MEEGFVNVDGIPTHIITWGSWIEGQFRADEVIIGITGNPGLASFYTEFMSTIHTEIGSSVPVWMIGHAGHDEPSNDVNMKVPDINGNEKRFNLDAQVKHKIVFIQKYVPENVKIYLIGHSIGAWITLELLKVSSISKKVLHCYLLFPTIERMASTSNGVKLCNYVLPYMTWIRYIVLTLDFLPMYVKRKLVHAYCLMRGIPTHFLEAILKCMRPSILDKIVCMAVDEMKTVKELDVNVIAKNSKILTFYYGATDDWTPPAFYKELTMKVENVDASVDTFNIQHAFVLQSSVEMGNIVSKWIINKFK